MDGAPELVEVFGNFACLRFRNFDLMAFSDIFDSLMMTCGTDHLLYVISAMTVWLEPSAQLELVFVLC